MKQKERYKLLSVQQISQNSILTAAIVPYKMMKSVIFVFVLIAVAFCFVDAGYNSYGGYDNYGYGNRGYGGYGGYGLDTIDMVDMVLDTIVMVAMEDMVLATIDMEDMVMATIDMEEIATVDTVDFDMDIIHTCKWEQYSPANPELSELQCKVSHQTYLKLRFSVQVQLCGDTGLHIRLQENNLPVSQKE
ncbi:hypothetical protein CEXT_36631 [Caerostris extrusa]|uniref:Uncharacterized protein n=1 Tax=Caerostris extrusa TaxID=172846 RepID=A0AAV4U3G0_CAEEX|nr:hypothetical protein CEXT_36631 [Caerostris extrusa]